MSKGRCIDQSKARRDREGKAAQAVHAIGIGYGHGVNAGGQARSGLREAVHGGRTNGAGVDQAGQDCTEPGVPPVPLSGITVEAVSEGDAMVNVPVYGSLREGVKDTSTEQLAPAARLVPQVFSARRQAGGTEFADKRGAWP